jgi:asparagine synthase (glutamine-hydrolysing)
MCGICGELNYQELAPITIHIQNQRQHMNSTVQKMTDALARRGPDREGFFRNGSMQMGHRRLSIIDLSDKANQPMQDEELCLVFNGTIYNYLSLRSELIQKNHQFSSTGDSEVILKAYREWGEDCVLHFNGIFAFAIWNNKTQKLFLARDKFGIKPLYYSIDQNRFCFASTVQSLLASQTIDTSLDPVALHFHFHLHASVPAPYTILNGIRKLGPGERMTLCIQNKTPRIEKYFQLKALPSQIENPSNVLTEKQWLKKTREALWAAVDLQRQATDVPIGILLSGGLDSSLLVAILAKLGGSALESFSIGFDEFVGIKADEFEFSDLIAKQFNTKHHRYLVPYSEMLGQIRVSARFMSEPMVSTDVTAFYLLSEKVSKEVKVVMSGQGADEVMGGYFWYPRMMQETGPYLQRFDKHYLDRSHSEYLSMIHSNFHPNQQRDVTRAHAKQQLESPLADSFMDAVFRWDVSELIVDDPVKRIDNMTMAWGLEARVPFLDENFVDLAMQIPAAIKLKQDGKFPLKALARGLIPDSVIDRPKGYFPVPVLRYVQGPYFNFMREVLYSSKCRTRGLYNFEFVDRLIANSQSDFTPIQGNKLWHLALLEVWLQENLTMRQ